MNDVKMRIAQVCEDESNIWFYDNIQRCICCSDTNFNEVCIDKQVDINDVGEFGAGIGIFKWNQKLYITYQRQLVVLIYSTQTKEYQIVRFNDGIESDFYNVVKIEETICFLPQKVNGKIYVFDMLHENFEQRTWMRSGCDKPGWLSYFLHQKDNKVFLPLYNDEFVFELDLLTYKYIIHKYEDLSLAAICRCENKVWIASTNSAELICMDEQSGKELCKYNSDSVKYREAFNKLFAYNGKMIGMPRFCDYILVVDYETEKVTRLYHSILKKYAATGTSLTYGYHRAGSLLYFLPWGMKKLLCVDIEKESICEKEIKVCNLDYFKYFYHCPERENDEVDVKDFFQWVSLKDKLVIEKENAEKGNKSVGKTIHEIIVGT